MPRQRTETLGAGDQTWLASTHGLRNCRTVTVNVSAFTASTHFPNGYIKSGTPFAIVSNLAVPYTSAEGTTTGAGVLAGHLFTDQAVVGTANFSVPMLDHGRVRTSKVPQGSDAFTAPVAAAKRANTTVVYV